MSSTSREKLRPADAVAGVLAAGALFLGFFELFYRPFRLTPVAIILALVATAMSKEQHRLASLALIVIGVCFVAGSALQVITNHPLY